MVGLNHYSDIDLNKTTIHVDISTNDITINAYVKSKNRICPFCNSNHVHIHSHLTKKINHPSVQGKKVIVNFHQIKFHCLNCNKFFIQDNPFTHNYKKISNLGVVKILELPRNPRKTFLDISIEFGIPPNWVKPRIF